MRAMFEFDRDRYRGRCHARWGLCLLLIPLLRPSIVQGYDDLAQKPPPAPPLRTALADRTPSLRPPALEPTGPVDESEIHYAGKPSPGSRITLAINGSDDAGTSYRWIQIEGPKAEISDPIGSRITLTIPQGAERLRFLLLMKDSRGERRVRVTVPVAAATGSPAIAGIVADATLPRADAGDDQIGLVGRTLSLNGSRSSTPATKPGSYRWIQVAGPKIAQPSQDKQFFSFIPLSAGVYRFMLVVSENDVISEPDEVVVTVGDLAAVTDPATRSPVRLPGLDQTTIATAGLSNKPLAERIADVFDQVADRADVYPSFDYLSSEMTRGLDVVLSRDPQTKLIWSEGIFLPLSRRLEAELLAAGLDLRLPYAQQQPLTAAHKDAIRKFFRAYAQEFRSAARAR